MTQGSLLVFFLPPPRSLSLLFSVVLLSAEQCRAESGVKAWREAPLYACTRKHTLTKRGRLRGEKDAVPSHDLLFSSTLKRLPGNRGKVGGGWGESQPIVSLLCWYKCVWGGNQIHLRVTDVSACVGQPVTSSNCLCSLNRRPLFVLPAHLREVEAILVLSCNQTTRVTCRSARRPN